MKLVHDKSSIEVRSGDVVHINNVSYHVVGFDKPHKPSSTGKVYLNRIGERGVTYQYYPSVINATWIEREDR